MQLKKKLREPKKVYNDCPLCFTKFIFFKVIENMLSTRHKPRFQPPKWWLKKERKMNPCL